MHRAALQACRTRCMQFLNRSNSSNSNSSPYPPPNLSLPHNQSPQVLLQKVQRTHCASTFKQKQNFIYLFLFPLLTCLSLVMLCCRGCRIVNDRFFITTLIISNFPFCVCFKRQTARLSSSAIAQPNAVAATPAPAVRDSFIHCR